MTPSLSSDGTVVLTPAPVRVTADDVRRCTTRCTETDDGVDVLARAVALVASLPLTDDERAAVVSRLAGGGCVDHATARS